MLETQQDCSRLESKLSNRDVLNARFMPEFINVQNNGGSLRPLLYKKDVSEILEVQVLMTGDQHQFSVLVTLEAAMEAD